MRIKILSDSTCDLSQDLLQKHDITLVPLIVVKDGQEYQDGVTITPEEIFAHVAAGGSLCTTAARSVGYYQEQFAKYASAYDGVVHINIGSHFSSSYQNACLAAEEFNNVLVVDSQNLSTGHGLVVLKAWHLAQTCQSLAELNAELQTFIPRVEASFLLDRLDYMVKGGRCSSVMALGANILNLKPCIEVKDGKMTVVKKYRGGYAKCLTSYVKDRLDGRDSLDHELLFLTHTPVSGECLEAVRDAIRQYGGFFRQVEETQAGCTVSCHCGPGTLGILFVRK
ncbi:MAG TPA: DegV family protein [Candidatus Faecousia intestinigallinarum]|nr:DegV family protein [Candidatus Faecousia intestinigallinarum]